MKRKEKTFAETWAESEIANYRKEEAPDKRWRSAEYMYMCGESAIKAYNCILEDDPSMVSVEIIRSMLNRLLLGKPLSPINDTPDVWSDEKEWWNVEEEEYQCKRMPSLFKIIHSDGTVEYRDVDRFIGVDKDGNGYHSNVIDRVLHKTFPIKMPYMPDEKPYKVFTEDLLTDPNNGDFDTLYLKYVITPNGERHEIERFFKDNLMYGWVEIEESEYYARALVHEARIKTELEEIEQTLRDHNLLKETEGNE